MSDVGKTYETVKSTIKKMIGEYSQGNFTDKVTYE